MGTQNGTIQLNGYTYDAKTGARLGRAQQPNQSRNIDGFVRQKPTKPRVKSAAKPTPPSQPKITQESSKKPQPSHQLHSKLNKSKTLRRQGLTKPKPPTQKVEKIPSISRPSFGQKPQRLTRAQATQQSKHVSKFNPTATYKPVAMKQQPQNSPEQTQAATQPQKSMLPLSPFDMALQRSKSHEQPKIKKSTLKERLSAKLRISPRALSLGIGLLIVLTVGGIYARQHVSTLAVQLAATRAGVEANIPSYEPAGFRLAGPVEYSSGQVALSYQSNSDSRNFKIVQKNSDWNSQALLENFIQAEDKSFQTVQDKGKTIYIYDGNNATWVSGGVWYQVEGESSLNTDQLLRIASGL